MIREQSLLSIYTLSISNVAKITHFPGVHAPETSVTNEWQVLYILNTHALLSIQMAAVVSLCVCL